jgi:hypothetical protein
MNVWFHLPSRSAPAVLATLIVLLAAPSARAASDPDSLYLARHPSLLFGDGDLPALRARVSTPGTPADTYAFVRDRFETVYGSVTLDSLVYNDGAQEQIVNIGLAAYLEDPVDTTALELGRQLTLHIVRNWAIDTDAFGSSLRLRAISIGYDLYFRIATPEERAEVRTEAASYVAYMTTNMNYDIWLHRPYVSNKSAMICAALGLAAIAFSGEIDPALTAAAFTRTDALYAAWRDAHVADDGCYREGSLYAGWSLRNLVYYFQARKRYDGTDFSGDWALRQIERWLAYEFDPRGGARLNNIQDQTDFFLPLARHTTYFDWAMSEWGSGLSHYLWHRASGPLGADMGDENDKAATVLWHQDVPSVNPGTILPEGALWESRGLYYYRSGWPAGAASDDIAFSFYSGEFRGATRRKTRIIIRLRRAPVVTTARNTAKQTEAHNTFASTRAGSTCRWVDRNDGDRGAHAERFCGLPVRRRHTATRRTVPTTTPACRTRSSWSWGYAGANLVQWALAASSWSGGGFPPTCSQDDIRRAQHASLRSRPFSRRRHRGYVEPAGPVGVAVGRAFHHAITLACSRLPACNSNLTTKRKTLTQLSCSRRSR